MQRILQNMLVAGSALALSTSLFAHQTDNEKIVAGDALPGDAFGTSVSIDFETSVVGAPGSDTLGAEAGAAYVFTFDGLNWNELTKLLASNGAAGDGYGSAVAIDGDTILVGAPSSGAGGAAYVYRFDGLNWNEEAILTPAGLPAAAALGFSVALSGDTAAIGRVKFVKCKRV